jgi:hypothetical protein
VKIQVSYRKSADVFSLHPLFLGAFAFFPVQRGSVGGASNTIGVCGESPSNLRLDEW